MSTAREHYIPLRPAEMVQKLANDPALTIFESELFRQFCRLVEATIHHEYWSRLNELKAVYAPFDPDGDSLTQPALDESERKGRCRQLFEKFDSLLERANYRRLTREDLEQALRTSSGGGLELHIDLDLFERLEIYVRGDCLLPQPRRSWRKAWRTTDAQVPSYRRLAVIFRLRQSTPLTGPLDEQAVVLKLFKNIPQMDVESLLPGANIRISWLEQAKIVLPTLSGVGLTLFKLLKGAAALTFASVYGLIAFLGLISGTVGYGLRSFYGYLHTREKYQLSLTRNLYFQNLDNNAGVLYHLFNEAEEQEFREIAICWWLLWRGGLQNARSHEIDRAAERWLAEKCKLQVDFEVSDALSKLHRLGLAHPKPNGRWRAVSIDEALETLDRAWDEQFAYHRPSPGHEPLTQPRIWRAAA